MTYIGNEYYTKKPIEIDLTKHTCVVGGSGMGKSTFLANCYIDQVREGGGVALIDPHGDLADTSTRFHPKSRMWDYIYFDPHANRIIPMNPFYFKDPELRELAKGGYFQIKKGLAGDAAGPEFTRISLGAIDAICEYFPRPSPVHEFRFLADHQFRMMVLDDTQNPFLRMFKNQYDSEDGKGLRPSESMSRFSSSINKTGKLMRQGILPIIGHDTSIDFLKIMNESKVIVFRLPKGRGEEEAKILGSIAISSFSIAALRREKQKDRPDFLLIADEAPNFGYSGRVGSILAEGRKFALSYMPALQGFHQFSDEKEALDMLSNCGNQVVYNCSGKDAELMANNWGFPELAREITDLPKFHFFLRHFIEIKTHDGVLYEPIVQKVKAAPPIGRRGDEAKPTKLIKHSLERWGTDRRAAEAKIMKFLAA